MDVAQSLMHQLALGGMSAELLPPSHDPLRSCDMTLHVHDDDAQQSSSVNARPPSRHTFTSPPPDPLCDMHGALQFLMAAPAAALPAAMHVHVQPPGSGPDSTLPRALAQPCLPSSPSSMKKVSSVPYSLDKAAAMATGGGSLLCPSESQLPSSPTQMLFHSAVSRRVRQPSSLRIEGGDQVPGT